VTAESNAKSQAKKRPVNLRVDAELLDLAQSKGINLSKPLETALRTTLRQDLERDWRAKNAAAIESFNRYVEKNGNFGAEFREW
jgi:antitoxin CcdA